MSRELNRSVNAINVKANRLKIDRRSHITYHKWSPREVLFIKEFYPLEGAAFVANKLKCSEEVVRN